MRTKQKIALIGIMVSAVSGFLAAAALIGHEARLVDVIGVFASGFGAGAALVFLLRSARVPPRLQTAPARDADA